MPRTNEVRLSRVGIIGKTLGITSLPAVVAAAAAATDTELGDKTAIIVDVSSAVTH